MADGTFAMRDMVVASYPFQPQTPERIGVKTIAAVNPAIPIKTPPARPAMI